MRRKYQEMVSHGFVLAKEDSRAVDAICCMVQDFVQDMVVHCNPPRTRRKNIGVATYKI